MDKQILADTLRNSGFHVEVDADGVLVSLDCSINKIEIEQALDFEIEEEHFVRINPETIFVPGWKDK